MKYGSPFKLVFLCLLVLVSDRVEGQIAVEILDAPASIFSFEPVYVTFEVRNEGTAPVHIPGSGCASSGVYLEVGRRGESLRDPHFVYDCGPSFIHRLASGARRLFFQVVQPGAEGAYELQAVLRSSGQCTGRQVGPEEDRIKPVRPFIPGGKAYDCWSGDETSQRIPVEVKAPETEVDLAAEQFLELDHPRWKNNWKAGLTFALRNLVERFPTSHYTFAAFRALGSDLGMVNIVILQPDNPLNPWVASSMAASLVYRNRPCAHPKPWGAGAPPDLDERYERVIAAYPPPEPVKAYLRQVEVDAAEDCARTEQAEPEKGTELGAP